MSDVAGFASSFLSAVVNFIIMAFILFCLMKGINKLTGLTKKEEAPAAPAPAPSREEELLAEIRDLLKEKK